MSAQPPTSSREDELREKRGQGLAARDAVRRDGDSFVVSTFSFRRGGATEYRVSRDEAGRVRCTCAEFALEAKANPEFRCEHIHAVKHWQRKRLDAKPSSPPESDAGRRADHEAVEVARLSESTVPSERGSVVQFEENEPMMRATEIEARLNGRAEALPEKASAASGRRLAEAQPSVREESTQAVEFVKVLRQLRQPVDAKLIRTREGWTDRRGNRHMVEYVEWHTVADILDRTYPSWSHRVQSITQIGGAVAVVASITIGNVTREGVGTGAGDTETGIKKAEHDALKRAAVKFGIARDLYQRETEIVEAEGGGAFGSRVGNSFAGEVRANRTSEPGFRGFPQDPRAKGTADLVTPKQLGMINRLAREAGVDADEEGSRLLGCKPEDLSKRAASSLIDYLKEYSDSVNKTQRRAS